MAAPIRCGYHGWRYDVSGAASTSLIPGRTSGRMVFAPLSLPRARRLIFVWPGASPRRSPRDADSARRSTDAYKTRRFGKHVACHDSFMHENLMDMNHQFLHRAHHRKDLPRYLGSPAGEHWMEVDYSFARTEGKPADWRGADSQQPARPRRQVSRDKMTIRTEYPYQTLTDGHQGDEPVMHLWIAYTPIGADQKSNRTFGLLSVRRPKIPGLLDIAWPVLPSVYRSGFSPRTAKIVEMEQDAYDRQGAD